LVIAHVARGGIHLLARGFKSFKIVHRFSPL
jgi:hypothetical protein